MRIGLLGFGEVGHVLAADLSAHDLVAFDPVVTTLGLSAPSAAAVARDAELVISAVTAANTLAAATSVAAVMTSRCWFLDLNSASPSQKQSASAVIEQAGGRYVEAAVMSPIDPRRLAAPILLGGPHAADFAPIARALGFSAAEVYADTVGPASATKLCRSIIVKGLEALVTESMLVASTWGVEQRVLDSLSNLFPADWNELSAYLISRSRQHGIRRAEEMQEAARMVSDAGVTPWLAQATALRQAATGRAEQPAADEQ
jgi:3-hydroxyisobutyrate dehydrogenase-like beta-hydroxyacid dehydrogenase